jgi:hypothetical protein
MKFLIIFLLLTSICWAQDIKFDKNKSEYIDKKGKKYSIIEIPLISTYSYKKPVIDETKILTEDEQDVVEFSLKENGRKLVHNQLRHAKNDYKNDFERGTVIYTPKCRNYSYSKVIIPDGTIIKESNFTQKEPHTVAIGGKNLTFIDCNLVNVQKDPTWTLQGSNNCQIKRIKKSEITQEDGSKKITISHQVEDKNGNFNEVTTDEEITNNIDDYNLVHLRFNK